MIHNCIEVKELMKSFGQNQVLKRVNFTVPDGSVYGFLGPNGAGKTTVIKILMGLIRHSVGKVILFGHQLETVTTDVRNKIGYLSQDPVFPAYFTGKEVMDLIIQLYRLEPADAQRKSQALLKRFELYDAKDRMVNTYSRGMKQKLGLATVLLPESALVILDEPVSALDPKGRVEVLQMIKEMQVKRTVFFSSHILSDVERICDQIAVINRGEIVMEGPTANILAKYSPREYIIKVRPECRQIAVNVLDNELVEYKVDGEIFRVKEAEGESKKIEERVLPELVKSGVIMTEFYRNKLDLEQIFLEIIK